MAFRPGGYSQSGQLLAKNVSSIGAALQGWHLILWVHLSYFAFGGNRSCESGKDASIIGRTVLSFFIGVKVSLFVGLGTVVSLVGNVVVFS